MATRIPLTEKARAKINLTLHVGPPDIDGYHPLSSLVVFADIGDDLQMGSAVGDASSLEIDGPFSNGLEADHTNIILQTAEALSDQKFDFKLTKKLPIAAGIGGGSADAAATSRLIVPENSEKVMAALMTLGADIPVCRRSETCLMQGKGEKLTALPNLETVSAVLVNPGVAVSTGKIFKLFDETKPALENLGNELPENMDLIELAKQGRNDLQDVAISIAPEIRSVLDALSDIKDCVLARMSGSGATCFGLFSTYDQALKAHVQIGEQYPDWWCVPTVLGDTQ